MFNCLFTLSDGFRRLNQPDKADEIYHLAADRGIFPSFWQRSLYNEPELRAQPVWTPEDTGIGAQLRHIQNSWESIRDEALTVLDAKTGGFINETENLKDTGYWAQYDLYVQGHKKVQQCSKTPITCSLIDSIPAIKSNRRDQVKFSVMKLGTFDHEVWYESESKNPRLILIIDLWHPDLSEKKRKMIPTI